MWGQLFSSHPHYMNYGLAVHPGELNTATAKTPYGTPDQRMSKQRSSELPPNYGRSGPRRTCELPKAGADRRTSEQERGTLETTQDLYFV